jgi:fibronectin-binding autotransporter adhesin
MKLLTLNSRPATAAMLLAALTASLSTASAQTTITWTNTANTTAWFTSGQFDNGRLGANGTNNWQTGNIATFGAAGTNASKGIDFRTNAAGGGTSLSIGAIQVLATRTNNVTIGSSSGTGTLTLNGATVEGNANTILRNASTNLLTLQPALTGTSMSVELGNATDNRVYIEGTGNINITASISGAGKNLSLYGTGAGGGTNNRLILSSANTHSGVTTVHVGGTLTLANVNALQNSTLDTGTSGSQTVNFSAAGTNTYNLGGLQGADALNLTAVVSNISVGGNNANTDYSGVLSGGGGLTKVGTGTLTLSGASANTLSGINTVSNGTLRLEKSSGVNAIAGNVAIGSGATLLLAADNQVANTSAVSLSGGTIKLGGAVSETFGALVVDADSFLDFNNAAGVNISFGTYSPTQKITVNNFIGLSTLVFKSDMTTFVTNSTYFSFASGYSSAVWNSLNTTFTITAIPEPSAVVAAVGLAGLMLWPARRRLGALLARRA